MDPLLRTVRLGETSHHHSSVEFLSLSSVLALQLGSVSFCIIRLIAGPQIVKYPSFPILFPLIEIYSSYVQLIPIAKGSAYVLHFLWCLSCSFLLGKEHPLFQGLPWHFICNVLMGHITVDLVPELFVYISMFPVILGVPEEQDFCLIYLYIPKAPNCTLHAAGNQ